MVIPDFTALTKHYWEVKFGDDRFKCAYCADEDEHRHLATLRISEKLMRQMFQPTPPGHWFRISEGVPLNAKLLTSYYDMQQRAFYCIYEHPNFPMVRDGVSPTHEIFVARQLLTESEDDHSD